MLTEGAVFRGRPGARSNRGRTSLKRRQRNEDPMREFDRLPAELRAWLAAAVLPWRPRSALRAYDRALSQSGDRMRALTMLDAIEARLVAKDARAVWGRDHPATSPVDGHPAP